MILVWRIEGRKAGKQNKYPFSTTWKNCGSISLFSFHEGLLSISYLSRIREQSNASEENEITLWNSLFPFTFLVCQKYRQVIQTL